MNFFLNKFVIFFAFLSVISVVIWTMNITTYTKRQSEVMPHSAVLNSKNSNRQGAGVLEKRSESRDEDRLIAMLKDQDSNVRKAAVQALGKKGNTLVVDSLIAALKDKDINVREATVKALGKIGDSRAVEPLISAMLISTIDEMKISTETAVRALVEIGQPAIEPLMDVLQTQRNSLDLLYVVRKGKTIILGSHEAIMEVLTNIGQPALDFLISALKVKNWKVQQSAAEALGKIGDKRAIDPLIEALEDKNVQRKAVEALGELRASRAVEPLIALLKVQSINDFDNDIVVALTEIGQPAVDHLIAGLKDINRNVRGEVTKALGEIKDKRAVDPLIEVAIYDNDSWVRETAVEALGKLGDSRIADSFIPILMDKDSNVRKAAVEALGVMGNNNAIDPLIPLLKDEDSQVRKAAAEAFGKIGDSRAEIPLIGVLKDKDSKVRKAGALAIGKRGNTLAVDPLIVALKDEDIKVREAAAEALGEIRDSRAIDPLITLLKDKSIHAPKAKSIKLDDPNLSTWLEEDEGISVRKAAAEALGKLGDSRAVEPLIVVLQNEDDEFWQIRQWAAWALGEVGDARAVGPLISALNDNMNIRDTATVALLRIGNPAIESLIGVLKDNDSDVRDLAARMLDNLEWHFSNEDEQISYYIAKRNWDECVKIGNSAVNPLIEVLKGSGYLNFQDAVFGAARALIELKDRRTVDPLIAILKNEDSYATSAIIWVLGEMGDPRAVESLIQLMQEGSSETRKAVAWALGILGDKRAVPSLVLSLQDWNAQKNWLVGGWDLTALTKTGLDPFWKNHEGPVPMREGPIVWALEKLNWEPQNIEEKIYFLVAKRDWKTLRSFWGQTKAVLLKDVTSSEYFVMENAIAAFMGIGDETIIPDLIDILEQKGTKTLAEAYLNCGHAQLEKTVINWGKNRGYHIEKGSGQYLVTWGE
jgi:HEAT repeat protein